MLSFAICGLVWHARSWLAQGCCAGTHQKPAGSVESQCSGLATDAFSLCRLLMRSFASSVRTQNLHGNTRRSSLMQPGGMTDLICTMPVRRTERMHLTATETFDCFRAGFQLRSCEQLDKCYESQNEMDRVVLSKLSD